MISQSTKVLLIHSRCAESSNPWLIAWSIFWRPSTCNVNHSLIWCAGRVFSTPQSQGLGSPSWRSTSKLSNYWDWWRKKTAPQPWLWDSHLWASQAILSAKQISLFFGRWVTEKATEPLWAASIVVVQRFFVSDLHQPYITTSICSHIFRYYTVHASSFEAIILPVSVVSQLAISRNGFRWF